MNNARLLAAALAATLLYSSAATAADHNDGPQAAADPAADVDDLYVWMSPDAERVYLAMTLGLDVSDDAVFSDAVQYVFHTSSQPAYGAGPGNVLDIVCVFEIDQRITCNAGGEVVVRGRADDEDGLESRDGSLRVFAGVRSDPFFFNLAGFSETAKIVTGAASGLTFDGAGCPLLDEPTADALVTQLASAPGGGTAANGFDGFNALTLVVDIDKALLTTGGPILGAWASTNVREDDSNAIANP